MELWESNQLIGEEAINKLLIGYDAAEREIYDILREYLTRLKLEDGKFVRGQSAARVINELTRAIAEVSQAAVIDDAVTDFLLNFDGIADNMVDLHSEQSGIKVPNNIVTRQQQFAIDATTYSLREANVSMRFIDPVKRVIYNRVTTGASLLDTEKALREMIVGTKDGGALSRYVGQVARDSFNQFEGSINQEVKSKYGMTNTRYVGSLVKDSRSQCRRWVAKGVISDKELANEIAWAYRNGSGMQPDTTVETFSIKRGGYNCRHTAFPVR